MSYCEFIKERLRGTYQTCHNHRYDLSQDAETMRELMKIFTTQSPIEFVEQNYVQVEGVTMGSPLSP